MKRNTIKWRIFKSNLVVIFLLIAIIAVVFNAAVRLYFENDIIKQINKIAARTEETALMKGPDIFAQHGGKMLPPPPMDGKDGDNNSLRFYFMLDRSLREPLSVLNADYILLAKDKSSIFASPGDYGKSDSAISKQVADKIKQSGDLSKEAYMKFTLSGTSYVALVKPVSQKSDFGLGWIIIYSSLQKINQLSFVINLILCLILLISAIIIVVFSSMLSKKISQPFSSLSNYINSIAERNFSTKIHIPVDDELQGFVNNINLLSEKLDSYDKAQKTFLQNVSHEFRTPLMSIQSYAEGIKYEVIEGAEAADVIIDESKRMTKLVEDILYLSRLDTIEENYHFEDNDLVEIAASCSERLSNLADKNGVKIVFSSEQEKVNIFGDEEKLSRAVTNVIGNCLRYAESTVKVTISSPSDGKVQLEVADDGPGFGQEDLPYLFERFYKGKKGNFGLGLAITKNIIEKHDGEIAALNSSKGAVIRIKLPVY